MKKFLVLYMAPVAVLDEWMKKPEDERKGEDGKMMTEWQEWMQANKDIFAGMTAGAGKTKRVTKGEVMDVRNDIMLYSEVQGESHEAVAERFKNHPHFGIPEATIEIMQINPLPGFDT